MASMVGMCPLCKRIGPLDAHHMFHRVKWAVALYPDLIDDPKNIQWVCSDEHAGHASPRLIHYNELEFCAVMGIRPRSKTCNPPERKSS